jgi:Icc-related predicted phosphoesterase
MKIISLPDLHGSLRYLTALGPMLRQVDLVVLPGDLTISGTAAEAERVIKAIQQYNPRVWAVPGGYDTQRVNQYLSEQSINLHKQSRDEDGCIFIGVGGDLYNTGAPREHLLYDNVQFDIMLHETIQGLSRRIPKILITHYPPQGTLVDRTRSGQQIGSRSIRTFIEEIQPLACLTGYLHDAPNQDVLGQTCLLNPGPIWLHHSYGYLEIIQQVVTTAEIRFLPSGP